MATKRRRRSAAVDFRVSFSFSPGHAIPQPRTRHAAVRQRRMHNPVAGAPAKALGFARRLGERRMSHTKNFADFCSRQAVVERATSSDKLGQDLDKPWARLGSELPRSTPLRDLDQLPWINGFDFSARFPAIAAAVAAPSARSLQSPATKMASRTSSSYDCHDV